VVVIPIGT